MKSKILLVSIIIIFLTMCKEVDKAKYEFIDSIIKYPNEIEAIIDTCKFYHKFAQWQMRDIREHIIENKFSEGWYSDLDKIFVVTSIDDTSFHQLRHQINIKSNFNGKFLVFTFTKKIDKWIITDISISRVGKPLMPNDM